MPILILKTLEKVSDLEELFKTKIKILLLQRKLRKLSSVQDKSSSTSRKQESKRIDMILQLLELNNYAHSHSDQLPQSYKSSRMQRLYGAKKSQKIKVHTPTSCLDSITF